jgi:outer membrane protein
MSEVEDCARRAGAARTSPRSTAPSHLLALALLFAAGCAVDQAKEVETYRRVLDGDNPSPVAPFEATDDLDLVHALALANLHNETLVLQGEDYLQALINENRAAATFLPIVNLTPSFNAQHSTGGIGTTTSRSLPINGTINIFSGFRDVALIASAASTSEQFRQLLLDQQDTLMLSVAQTFYQVLRSQQSAEVLVGSLKLQAERLRDIQARLKLGIAKPLDVAQTEADEAAAQVSLLQARSDARIGRATLAFLIGMPSVEGKLIDGFEAPATVAACDELEVQAKEKRQDLLASIDAVEAARHDVDAAFRQHYPSINLSASYLISETPSFGSVWNLALSGLIPIFRAGLIHEDVRAAWSRYRQAVASQSLLERQVAEDVQIAYENLATSRTKIDQLRTQVAAAQRAFDLSDRSYQLGGASNLDRLTAQNTLLISQLQLSSEQYNLKVFYLDLLRSMGTQLRTTL